MAQRTTRNKLRWQAEMAQSKVINALEHLRYLDELADGQSKYINDNLPLMVTPLTIYIQILEKFREGL